MTEISENMIDKAMSAFTNAINSTGPCSRCEGRGYHHGFGEHGHDPDWCEVCGGSGFVPGCDDREAMRKALEAAFSLPSLSDKEEGR